MKNKFLIMALICAIAAGWILWGKRNPSSTASHVMSATEVNVYTVIPQSISISRDLSGRTLAFKVAEIRPQATGIIIKKFFEEGSNVAKGQQLYQIDPSPYQAEYDSAYASLMKAEADLKFMQAKSVRYAELFKTGKISKQDYDNIQTNLQQSKSAVAIAKSAVATAKINIDYTKVFSPISGRIGKSTLTEGALVTTNQPQALAVVWQFDQIYVDVTQSSNEFMDLRQKYGQNNMKGISAQLLLGSEGDIYEEPGELQFSGISVDQSTGTVQLRTLFPNPNHEILPGLFVRIRLTYTNDNKAILIPQQAVIRTPDGGATVWSVDKANKVYIKPIKVSHIVNNQWLVTEGLSSGDRIVVNGIMKIRPGVEIKPIEVESADKDILISEKR